MSRNIFGFYSASEVFSRWCPIKRYLALVLASAAMPLPVFAQDAIPAVTASSDGDSQLQDIVVTAQRRSERVQDTPISVSAFDSKRLAASGVSNALQLAQIDPALNISFNADTAYPFIRGIGNIAGGVIGNEASVGTYIDNVYYARLFSSLLSLGDVERVEVLKGPQGTLFGRNASGGAIQIFTREPGREHELRATLGYASYNTISGNVFAATPITDTLSLSVAAGGYNQGSGWGHSVVDGRDVYLGGAATVRSKLIWQPSDSTRIKLIGYFAYSDDDFGNVKDILPGTYQGTAPGPDQVVVPSLASRGGYYDASATSDQFPIGNTVKTWGGSAEVNQSVGFADLVSISAYRDTVGDAKNQVALAVPGYFSLPIHTTDRQFSQELQLKSANGGPVNWIVGGYYFHYLSGYNPFNALGPVLDGIAPGTVQSVYGLQTVNSYSAFGQATFPVADRTNVTLCARYSIDNLKGYGRQELDIPGIGVVDAQPAGVANPYRNSKRYNAFTWRAALDHHFTSNLMMYGSASRGFKAGTYNTAGLVAPPARPEVVNAYELGFKSDLFDRKLRFNAALFLNDIKDPQVQTAISVGPSIAIGLTNAEKAQTKGVEVETTVLAARGLQLRANAVYLDAVFKKFSNAPFYSGALEPGTTLTGPVFLPASGSRMVNSPKWRVTGGVNYTTETNIGEFTADVNVAYTSRFSWTIQNVVFQEPTTLISASVSYTPHSKENLTFRIWGKNLGDVKYDSWVQGSAFPGGTGGYQRQAAAPLTVGGEVSFRL